MSRMYTVTSGKPTLRKLQNELDKIISKMDDMQASTPAAPPVQSQLHALMGARALEDVQADIAEITATISKLKRDFNDGKYKEGILDEQVNAYEDEITKMTRTGNYKVPDLRQKRQAQQQARAQSIDLMRAGESIQYRINAHKKRLEELNFELSGFATARSTPPPA